jgi:hypothetical protein
MKLAAIVTALALTGTEAIYLECCKTASEKCPNVMVFKDNMETDIDGENFKMCCQPDLAADKIPDVANLSDSMTCIDDVDAGNGMSISVMAVGLPGPSAKLDSAACCEVDALVEPGKLRSSTSSNCPINMHSMADAKGPNNNPLCCEAEDANLDNLEGIVACSQMTVSITNLSGGNDSVENNNELQEGEPTENQEVETTENQEGDAAEGQEGDLTENQEGEPAEENEGETVDDGETIDNVADSQQELDETNSASATSAFVAALLGAALHIAL